MEYHRTTHIVSTQSFYLTKASHLYLIVMGATFGVPIGDLWFPSWGPVIICQWKYTPAGRGGIRMCFLSFFAHRPDTYNFLCPFFSVFSMAAHAFCIHLPFLTHTLLHKWPSFFLCDVNYDKTATLRSCNLALLPLKLARTHHFYPTHRIGYHLAKLRPRIFRPT